MWKLLKLIFVCIVLILLVRIVHAESLSDTAVMEAVCPQPWVDRTNCRGLLKEKFALIRLEKPSVERTSNFIFVDMDTGDSFGVFYEGTKEACDRVASTQFSSKTVKCVALH